MRKSEHGAIPVLIIMLAAILVIAGGVAAYVYNKTQDHKTRLVQPTNKIEDKLAKTPDTSDTTEDDLATGESKEIGISFKYPTEWGEASTKSDRNNNQSAGSRYTVSFSKNDDVSIAATTNDYTIDGIGGVCLYTSPATSEDSDILKSDSANGYVATEFVNTSELKAGALAQVGGVGNGCDFLFLAQRKLVKNPNINYIKVYQFGGTKKIETAAELNEFANDSNSYYTPAQKNEYVQFVQSIKEI